MKIRLKKFIFYKKINEKKVTLLELNLNKDTSKEILKKSLSYLKFDGIDTIYPVIDTIYTVISKN